MPLEPQEMSANELMERISELHEEMSKLSNDSLEYSAKKNELGIVAGLLSNWAKEILNN